MSRMSCIVVIGVVCAGLIGNPAAIASTLEFVNGQWFDGSGFQRTVFYSVNGMLTKTKPDSIDETIDLADAYVIPPFGEAHSHNVEGLWDIDEQILTYIAAGVFYVKNPANIREFSSHIADRINTPTSIDVVFSNGAITATGGHPVQLYEGILRTTRYQSVVGEVKDGWFENRGYYIVDDEADLQEQWPMIMADKPDFIKTILSYSEDFEKNRANQNPYVRKGLDPALLPLIVEKAHQSGLRVTTHVETAVDFHNAVVAGVDEIGHLPGYYIHAADQEYRAPIAEDDARLAAETGTVIVTTTVLSKSVLRDTTLLPLVQKNQRKNLRLLYEHGAVLAIGSDWSETSLPEAMNIHELDVFDNLALLKMWCEATPRTIFPERKIGQLREGYEASFLVLEGNPLEEFEQVENIRLRFKQGHRLDLP